MYKINNNKVLVADPGRGLMRYTHNEFENHWLSTPDNNGKLGIALLMKPSAEFAQIKDEAQSQLSFGRLFGYLLNSPWK